MLKSAGARLGQVWRSYEAVLYKRPLLTQSVTSAGLWASGDVLSQFINDNNHLDWQQTAWTTVFGAVLVGTVGHVWYQFLDKTVSQRFTRGTVTFILAKVALDELTFGPLHVGVFFAFMTKAQGGTWEDVNQKLRRDFWSAYIAELAVWPAFQTWNFSKVPVRHQLLAVNVAALGDATFLCWVKSQEDWMAKIGLRAPRQST